ncbi:MAG: tyrosine recombinase XerD [Prevotella sp.]|nr:tyrosine recombinase XerD [Bacteroides sp.]MCM1366550.1 tyrosine recombinase XerD [Prevotella sp.]MCM1436860.1 tyrosine recombinase XerD [Prevotella sp.]
MRPVSDIISDFQGYLTLERSHSQHTVLAYSRDVGHLLTFLEEQNIAIEDVSDDDIHNFMSTLSDLGINHRSQARVLAGIRSFFRFLVLEHHLDDDPTELIPSPKLPVYLPDFLEVSEIDAMIDALPPDKNESVRNRAIIETLYGSGLRVSELTDMRLSRIDFKTQCAIVEGKGSKQRIVPLSPVAVDAIMEYLPQRHRLDIKPGHEDILFLNRRGKGLTRVMIFHIVKTLAQDAGIKKHVSPHTLRHSFATHLLEGGANLRVIQEMLGHEKIETTGIYVHLDRSKLRNELENHHPHYSQKNKPD